MTPEEKTIIENKITKLENQLGKVSLMEEQINDLNFKAYGREGLKNLKKTWIDFIKPTLGTGTVNNLGTWLDDNADKYCGFNFMIPRDLSPIFYELVWTGGLPGNGGNIYAKAKIGAGQKGETGSARTSIGSYLEIPCLADYKLNYTNLQDFGLDLTVMKKDDYVYIEVERDATNAADTIDEGVIIHGLKITYI